MRSEQVYAALKQGRSRYEICQLVFMSVRRCHKPGLRFQDTINSTLVQVGSMAAPKTVADESPTRLSTAA
jgi:hypothetical protein